MRTILLSATAAVALATTIHATQAAQLRATLDGSEIQRSSSFGFFKRSEVIRLAPDGSFTGTYQSRRPTLQGGYERREGAMQGRWTLQGETICFSGSGLEHAGQNCSRLTKGRHADREWSATDTRTGDIWEFFVYSGRGGDAPSRAAR